MTIYQSIRIVAQPVLMALALACVAGCSKSTTRSDGATAGTDSGARSAALGDTVALHRGESVMFGTELLLTFNRVSEDSRCPEDVTCVWAGNARVELAVRKSGGASLPVVLNTGLTPRDTAIDRYQIALVGLAPATNSRRAIEPDEYVASVSVSMR